MSGCEIDDPAAAKSTAHPPRHLPGFVQLLTREAPCVAHSAREAIEQGFAWKSREVAIGQAPLR